MGAHSLDDTLIQDAPLDDDTPVSPAPSDDDDRYPPSARHNPYPSHTHQHPTPLHYAKTFLSLKPALVSALPTPSLFTPPTTPPPSNAASPQPNAAVGLGPLLVHCDVRARIPTMEGGEFFLHLYQNNRDGKEHLALVYGDDIRSRSLDAPRPGESEMDRVIRGAYHGRLRHVVTGSGSPLLSATHAVGYHVEVNSAKAEEVKIAEPPLVRIHSECYTGEVVHSGRCDCGDQLDEAMRLMQREGRGVIVYLRQEGRNIGLLDKLKAYNLQDLGYDTVSANLFLHHAPDERTYDIATAILADLGLTQVRLLTNNPDKIEQIEGDGVCVTERVPMAPRAWVQGKIDTHKELDLYLKVKVEKMGHIMDLPKALL
ncbi:GTP cyclohydrolase II-domain-containing protein [Jimgerdemannia flammicorona]|uniref:GTP cyclohydrolase II n=1 Tax=Jimgerdemannia flammicorona TaxID=994334 RepID=A0A433DH23_9FUNG|nr:GTP cyclohydrolase II-domain-containing protein [Jimgerdemannia flammicorona]